MWNSLDKHRDTGLLIMRLGVGLGFFWFQGWPKWFNEQALITNGEAISFFGITSGYYYWGLAAALVEGIGGLLIAAGLLFRPASLALFFVMAMALIEQYSRPMPVPAHPFVNMFVFLGLFFTGPGRYSVEERR